MRTPAIEAVRIPMHGPGDTSGLVRAIESGAVEPEGIIAVMAKTEGNGCVNDFTREYTTLVLAGALAPYLGLTAAEVERRIAFVMSGGTEGVLSPHATVFCRRFVDEKPARGGKRLAAGIAFTRDFLPEELGRSAQIEETAAAVRAAMRDAGIEEANDVHFVQIKCPLLTSERIEAAKKRGRQPVTDDPYVSMGYSRGASALGVAVALGEIAGSVADADVLRNWALHSSVASVSAGIEVERNLVLVLGNSPRSASRCVIDHAVMQDAIDLRSVLL